MNQLRTPITSASPITSSRPLREPAVRGAVVELDDYEESDVPFLAAVEDVAHAGPRS